jgi:hypothetical protein
MWNDINSKEKFPGTVGEDFPHCYQYLIIKRFIGSSLCSFQSMIGRPDLPVIGGGDRKQLYLMCMYNEP